MWGIISKALLKVSTNISTIQGLKKAFSDNCDFGIFHILSVAAERKMMSYALFFCGHMKLSSNVKSIFLTLFSVEKEKLSNLNEFLTFSFKSINGNPL